MHTNLFCGGVVACNLKINIEPKIEIKFVIAVIGVQEFVFVSFRNW